MNKVNDYMQEVEKEFEQFNFVRIEFLVDARRAQQMYQKELKENINGVKDRRVSFTDWLEMKKFEAAETYVKHSNYNIGR